MFRAFGDSCYQDSNGQLVCSQLIVPKSATQQTTQPPTTFSVPTPGGQLATVQVASKAETNTPLLLGVGLAAIAAFFLLRK